MNIWRWMWRSLMIAAVICGGVVIALQVLVDPNTIKEQIITSVRENSGRELVVAGDVHLEFFPYLGVAVEALELGNTPGFEGPYVTLQKAQLKVRLLPLLLSRLDVVAVDIKGLTLHLTRDAQGRGNWGDLAAEPVSGTAEKGVAKLSKDRRVPLLASLIVDGLHVSDASVIWRDAQSGEKVDVGGIELNVSDFAFGEAFDVETHAVVVTRGVTADVNFATKAVLELDRLAVEDLVLTGQLFGDSLPKSPETISVTADYFSTDGRLDNAQMDGLGLSVQAGLRNSGNGTTSGSLDIAPFSPKNVFDRLGLSMPAYIDAKTMDRLALACEWTGSGERLDVSKFNLNVDNSSLQGEASVVGLADPSFTFNLRADTLNVDRYLPRTGGNSSGIDASTLPLQALRKLDVNGTLTVDSLILFKASFSDVRAAALAKNGMLRLERIEAKTYGGRLDASASMDVRAELPKFSWSHSLSGLQLGPFLRDLHGQESISGTAESVVMVQAQGLSGRALKQSLNGNLSFKVVDGAVHGINIAEKMRDEFQKLKGQASGPDEPDRTDFSVLSGSGIIDAGVETTRDLLLLAPRFKVTGGGRTDLVRENLDFNLLITLEGTQGKFENGIFALSRVPVRVSGPLRQPVVSADTAAILKGLGLSGGQTVQDIFEGVGSGLNKGVEGLKRLFE